MKKTTKKTSKKSTGRKTINHLVLLAAVSFLLLGIFGLLLASLVEDELRLPKAGISSNLKVIEGKNQSPAASSDSGQSLQNAAVTKDFIEGRDASEVQPGGSVDQLIGERQIQ